MTDSKSSAPGAGPERIQKVLARTGVGSRRQVEDWIRQGRVKVDGIAASLGQRIGPGNTLELDGRVVKLQAASTRRVLLYHKPEGELCTRHDPAGRRTVFDTISELDGERLVCVGRLDLNTSGVLLLTTDGDLANRLMHPASQIEREYRCRVHGKLEKSSLERLRRGIRLDDGIARFDRISAEHSHQRDATNRWYRVSLKRGRYREVRRLWEAVGGRVNRLIRVRYGCISLDKSLKPGDWVELEAAMIDRLLNAGKS